VVVVVGGSIKEERLHEVPRAFCQCYQGSRRSDGKRDRTVLRFE